MIPLRYSIGRLTLYPRRELLDGTAPVVIGNRALNLLSALAEADGKVVSKDELFERVWPGAIVEDNALQAQVHAVRKALGAEAGRLVTVHGRGYKLMMKCELRSSPGAPTATPGWGTRRIAIASALAAIVTASGGFVLWRTPGRRQPAPPALALYQRAQLLERDSTFPPGPMPEASTMYAAAVRIDPQFAEGWAALALSQRYGQLGWQEPFGDPGLVRTAAGRALALDPGNSDAQLALVLEYSDYRRWGTQEAQLRKFLSSHPDHAFGHIALASLLADVGRSDDAVDEADQATRIEPDMPRWWFALARAMSLAGRGDKAIFLMDDALQRWPHNRSLFAQRYWSLIETRQFGEAAAFARDRSHRPPGVPDNLAQQMAQIADDLTSPSGVASRASYFRQKVPVRDELLSLPVLAPLMVQLGMASDVLDLLEACFLGREVRGVRLPLPGPANQRPTAVLFAPDVLTLREDPRFTQLLARTGLDAYWRKSGTSPDFRRVG